MEILAAPLPLARQHYSATPTRMAQQGVILEKNYIFLYDLG
jgi:hypothetical protein